MSWYLGFLPLAQPVLASLGVIPKLGLPRAVHLALRGPISSPEHSPIRPLAREYLRRLLTDCEPHKRTLVVTGTKGVGKSVLVDSLLCHKPGVVPVPVYPGTSAKDIVNDTLLEIVGSHLSIPLVRRVIFFFQRLNWISPLGIPFTLAAAVAGFLLQGPLSLTCFVLAVGGWIMGLVVTKLEIPPTLTVLLRTDEFSSQPRRAEITRAVYQLRETWGLQVIVEGSKDSLEPELFDTDHLIIFDIPPLSKEETYDLPQVRKIGKDTTLFDTVYEVFGGIPAKYDRFCNESTKEEIEEAVRYELLGALSDIQDAVVEHSNMSAILSLFQRDHGKLLPLPYSQLVERKLSLPHKNKVLRKERLTLKDDSKDNVIVPATSAIAFVLLHDLKSVPSFDKIVEFVKSTRQSNQSKE